MRKEISSSKASAATLPSGYAGIRGGIVELLDAARHVAARSVNSLMTASYWEVGRRIVEAEQKGRRRAGYGEQLIERLSLDLTEQFGRGFSRQNLQQMRSFVLAWPIRQTVSGESPQLLTQEGVSQARASDAPLSAGTGAVEPFRSWRLEELAPLFTLPWSAYVRLLAVKDSSALRFYEAEALRGGWSVRQLNRQISRART
ncbi:hypothetical protein QF040_004259 [Variovorax sp. W2I14]